MTVWSRMSTAMSSATSVTNSENTIRTFATLRFAGDALDPEEISRVLKQSPTRAYKEGQSYKPGPRSPETTGKTGVWYFSTKRKIQSNDLTDHLNALERLISPFGDQGSRLREIRDIMKRRNLQAMSHASGADAMAPPPHQFPQLQLPLLAACLLISDLISTPKIAELSSADNQSS